MALLLCSVSAIHVEAQHAGCTLAAHNRSPLPGAVAGLATCYKAGESTQWLTPQGYLSMATPGPPHTVTTPWLNLWLPQNLPSSLTPGGNPIGLPPKGYPHGYP